jgi:hypothetical protein
MESLVLLDAVDLLEKDRDRLGQLSSSDPILRTCQGDPSFLSQSHSRSTVFFLIVPGRWLPREEACAMDTKGSSRPFKAVGRGIHSDATNSFRLESPPQRKRPSSAAKKAGDNIDLVLWACGTSLIRGIFKDAPLLTHVVLEDIFCVGVQLVVVDHP